MQPADFKELAPAPLPEVLQSGKSGVQQGARRWRWRGGRTVVVVPEDHGDEDGDESSRRGQLDGDGLSHEGGMGRPGWIGGWPRRGRKTDDDDGKGEVEQTLEPLIPVPPSFALALCGPDSLAGGQAHWTVSGHWSVDTGHTAAPGSPPGPHHPFSPTTEALYFAMAICAVSLGVGSKLMELVRFLSLTFFFLSCLLYPQVLPAHPEKHSQPRAPFQDSISEDPSSPVAWWTLDTACLHLCVGGSATAQPRLLSVPGPCKRGPSTVINTRPAWSLTPQRLTTRTPRRLLWYRKSNRPKQPVKNTSGYDDAAWCLIAWPVRGQRVSSLRARHAAPSLQSGSGPASTIITFLMEPHARSHTLSFSMTR